MAQVKIVKTNLDPATEKKILAGLKRGREDMRWVFANEEELRSKYANKFIAVRDRKVEFVNDDVRKLFATIKAAGEDLNDFMIEYVREKPVCLLF